MVGCGKLKSINLCAAIVVICTTLAQGNCRAFCKEEKHAAESKTAGAVDISDDLNARCLRVSTLIKAGRFAEALNELNAILSSHPDCWDAYVGRATIEQQLGRYKLSLRDLATAAEHQPLNDGALFVRGASYLGVDRYKESLADANKLISVTPAKSLGWLLRAQTLILTDPPAGKRAVQELIAKFPHDTDSLRVCLTFALKTDDWDSVERLLHALMKAEPNNPSWHTQFVNLPELRAQFLFLRAKLPRNSAQAMAQLSADVARHPHERDPLLMRAAYYLKNLDAEHAVADYTQAIKLDPKFVAAYTQRGIAYRSLEKFDKSFADFAQALKLNPLSTEAALACARLHRTLHQYPEAVAVYDTLVRNKPDSSLIISERSQTFLEMNKPEKALADAEKAVQIKHDFAELKTRAAALTACGKYKEAIGDYTNALILKPRDPKILQGRAVAYRKIGDINRALNDERAVQSFNDEVFENAPFR